MSAGTNSLRGRRKKGQAGKDGHVGVAKEPGKLGRASVRRSLQG